MIAATLAAASRMDSDEDEGNPISWHLKDAWWEQYSGNLTVLTS
jgi:hypothetical protein